MVALQSTIRTDGWTADWRLASALWDAYSGTFAAPPGEGRVLVARRPVAILCAGDPDQPIGERVVDVAEELRTYYPVVEGGRDAPLSPGALAARVAWHGSPEAARAARRALLNPGGGEAPCRAGQEGDAAPFVAVVQGARAGREESGRLLVKSWVVDEDDEDNEEEDPAADPDQSGFSVAGDVEVNLLLFEGAFRRGHLDDGAAEQVAQTAADMVIDGFLRFFFKIGHDHTRFRRGR